MYHENDGGKGFHYHVKFKELEQDNLKLKDEPYKVLDKTKLNKKTEVKQEEKPKPVINNSKQVFEEAKKNNIIKKEVTQKDVIKKLNTVEEPSFFDNMLEKANKVYTYLTSDVPITETLKIKEAADGNPTQDRKVITSNKSYITKPKIVLTSDKPKDTEKLKQDFEFEKKLGFNKPDINSKISKGTSYQNLNLGTYSRNIVDMSNGITVTYQPRNEKNKDRKDINNALFISDYLYDYDMTDGYIHDHARKGIERMKENIGNKNYPQKFVTVKRKEGNNWRVKVIPFSELKEEDFGEIKRTVPIQDNNGDYLKDGRPATKNTLPKDKYRIDAYGTNNNVYRQSWSKLSDLDISSDGTKIKLVPYYKLWKAALFQNQGLPFMDKQNPEHGLRLPGGKGNYGKYQKIDDLDQYGAYLGGTVTVISDDGKIVKKVSGSIKDIIKTALYIKNKTGGKEVHFLQSDAGSMNIKADANNNKITSKQMAIARNQEPQAGASEILLNE